MKRLIYILFGCCVGLVTSVQLYADEDCDYALKEAKSAYNAGNYTQAKALFEYVASECGSSYGNASSWVKKSKEAAIPKLTVQKTDVRLSAQSGTVTIPVSSNRIWKLSHANSALFTVNKIGDNITINYKANPYTSSRSDYIDVVTTDGSKSTRIYVTQSGKTVTLSVNKSSISASSSGKTETITVTSNVSWELQHTSSSIFSVTRSGNTLTVKVNANSSTSSRSDYFYIVTKEGDKKQKISISQTAKSSSTSTSSSSSSSSTPSVTFNRVWVDHNVFQGGLKGMKIHLNMNVYNLRSKSCGAIAYFYTESGTALIDKNRSYYTSDGKVSSLMVSFTPGYDNTIYNDLVIFMPYTELDVNYKGNFKFCVDIWNTSVSPYKLIKQSGWTSFTYTPY